MDKENEFRTVAAVDLGSNSFHMIVARLEETGALSIIDRLREPVRLGGGLKRNGKLGRKSRHRALECLEQFGQRIRNLPQGGCVSLVPIPCVLQPMPKNSCRKRSSYWVIP